MQGGHHEFSRSRDIASHNRDKNRDPIGCPIRGVAQADGGWLRTMQGSAPRRGDIGTTGSPGVESEWGGGGEFETEGEQQQHQQQTHRAVRLYNLGTLNISSCERSSTYSVWKIIR